MLHTEAEDAAAAAHAWLLGGLHHLAVPREDAEIELRRLKAICEVSFIAALLRGEDEAERLLEAIAPTVQAAGASGRFLEALWHQPQHANLYLPMLYVLGQQGQLSTAEWEDLLGLLRRLRRLRKERPPFRNLDFLFSLYLLTGDEGIRHEMKRTAAAGCLGADAGLATYMDGDEYALTHGVFYLAGFGSWSWPFGDGSRLSMLALLRGLGLRAEAEQNWDIYGEYIVAEAMLHPAATAIDLHPLLRAQRPDGSVPGPADLSQALRRSGMTDAEELAFLQDYHTTLVAWMALVIPKRLESLRSSGLLQDGLPVLPAEADAPTIELVPRYPELSAEWLALPAAFDSLLTGVDVTPPDRRLATEPQGVLPWLEWWHWHERILGDEPRAAADGGLEKELVAAVAGGSWRAARCLLLTGGAVDGVRLDDVMEPLLCAAEATPNGRLTEPEAVDRLVALGLLEESVEIPDEAHGRLRRLLDHAASAATLERNVFAIGPIVSFAGRWLSPEVKSAAETVVRDGMSRSLPFGFAAAGSVEAQRRSVAAECYLPQLQLANRTVGVPPAPSVATSSRSNTSP